MADSAAPQSFLVTAGWCIFYASGIIGCLVVYGVLQERVMDHPYGTEGAMFGTSVFLVFCNRLAAVTFAFCMTLYHGEDVMWKAPLWKYVAISLSNVYASTCQYEALKYVSFPVQMLGKSFKMMPVMVWGIIISGKRYKLEDWMVAALVTFGVTEFLMTGPISSESSDDTSSTSMKGLLLLLGFLLLDGYTSNGQEALYKEYKVSKYNQMLYVNGASTFVSTVTLLATGGFQTAFAFIGQYPQLLLDASYLSASAVAGQWFIYSQVKEFGALVFAATMNVRQVVSIIISYIEFGHSITFLQVVGLLVVFGALFYKSIAGFWKENNHHGEAEPLVKAKLIEEGGVKGSMAPEAVAKVG